MVCECCKAKISDGAASCDICGFPTLVEDGIDITALAADNRRRRLDGISVGIMTYRYGYDEKGTLKLKESVKLELAKASDLKPGEIAWADKDFESLESDRRISLDLVVAKPSGEVKSSVELNPGKVIAHSALGIMLSEGFTVRLAVGNRDENCLTEAVSLV